MMNTQALDALAALCGSAASTSSHAVPTSAGTSNNPSYASSYALMAQQLQLQEAHASATAAAHQAQAARQAALSSIPSDLLQAYLASTSGLGNLAPRNSNTRPRTSPLYRGGGCAGSGLNLSGGHDLAACSSHRTSPPARARAAKFLMAHPQPQQQLQYSLPSIALNRSPAASLVTHPAPYAAMKAVSASTPAPANYPRAVSTLSHNNPPPQMAVPRIIKASHSSDSEATPRPSRCGKKVNKAKPPPKKRLVRSNSPVGGSTLKSVMSSWEDKKEAKKAANRLSAHESRKRKKMLMNSLQDKNRELRRMEQILQSIPDLIVVFDSSGCMPFVSHSVTRFLDFTSDELEGTSFWDILTLDSIRLVKSAFMDALAIKRNPEDDSTLLWDGESMTVKLLDTNTEDNNGKLFSLKGVVHFSGESPECVCSIRPEEDHCEQETMALRSCNYKNISPSPRQISLPGLVTAKLEIPLPDFATSKLEANDYI